MQRSTAVNTSARAFLNSLLREWPHSIEGREFILDGGFRIPLTRFSLTGNHSYHPDFPFLKFLSDFTDYLEKSGKGDSSSLTLFKSRVESSIDNLFVTLKKIGKTPVDFLSAEQSLTLGHPFHPYPKSREEFSREDFILCSPETSPGFALHWLLLKRERAGMSELAEKALRELFSADHDFGTTSDWIPFPTHPWQLRKLRDKKWFADLQESGNLRYVGPTKKKWNPTSSLRTLYNADSNFMLKFSLSVRITNSIRHLLPREVVRGLEVNEVLATEKGKAWREEFPRFNIISEPAYIGITSENGELYPETLVVLRDNPFRGDAAKNVIVAGALFQEDQPYFQNLFKGKTPTETYRWFQAFLHIAILPLLRAQSDYGILFGAHQQNLLIRIDEFLPEAAWFRDCQGTGYTPLGLENFGGEVKRLSQESGNVLAYDYGLHLFAYYLIVNSTFGAIQALARTDLVTEENLVEGLRTFLLEERKRNPRDPKLLDHLLHSPTIRQKGNFRCCFMNLNENMTNDPLSIYNEIPNPLRSL